MIVILLNLGKSSSIDSFEKELISVAQTVNFPLKFFYTLSGSHSKVASLCPSVIVMYQGEVLSEVSLKLFHSIHIASFISSLFEERTYNESASNSANVSHKFLEVVRHLTAKQILTGSLNFCRSDICLVF